MSRKKSFLLYVHFVILTENETRTTTAAGKMISMSSMPWATPEKDITFVQKKQRGNQAVAMQRSPTFKHLTHQAQRADILMVRWPAPPEICTFSTQGRGKVYNANYQCQALATGAIKGAYVRMPDPTHILLSPTPAT